MVGTGVEVEKVVGANSDDGVVLQSSPMQVVIVAVEVTSHSSPEQVVGDGAGGVVVSAEVVSGFVVTLQSSPEQVVGDGAGWVVGGVVGSGSLVSGLVVSGLVVFGVVLSGLVVSGVVVSGVVVSGVVGSGVVGSGVVVSGVVVPDVVGSGLVGSGFTGVVVLSVKDFDFTEVGPTGVVFVVSLDVSHGVVCVVGFTGVVSGSEVVDFSVLVSQGVVSVAVVSVVSVTVVGFTGVDDVNSLGFDLVKDVDKTDELGVVEGGLG